MARGIIAKKVLAVLEKVFVTRGVPKHICSDNGSEFIAKAIRRHADGAGLELLYVEPGSPF